MLENKAHIINLFNAGVLTINSAEWYAKHDYIIICFNGKVVDITKESEA